MKTVWCDSDEQTLEKAEAHQESCPVGFGRLLRVDWYELGQPFTGWRHEADDSQYCCSSMFFFDVSGKLRPLLESLASQFEEKLNSAEPKLPLTINLELPNNV